MIEQINVRDFYLEVPTKSPHNGFFWHFWEVAAEVLTC